MQDVKKRNYRREYGTSHWHWCKNCEDFPTSNYTIRHFSPKYGDLCPKCKELEEAGSCEES